MIKIKKDCVNDNRFVRYNSDVYLRDLYLNEETKFKYFFNDKKLWVGKTELFSWENEKYERKYTLEGLKFSLFKDFVYNLPCLDKFDGSFILVGKELEILRLPILKSYRRNTKNPLCLVNKTFYKYCKKT